MKIDPDIMNLIPPLKPDEFQGLEQKILNEGLTEPLVVWKEQDILLDGHHRLEICKKHNIKPTFRYISLPDRKSAINWVIDNQLSRRNLDPFEVSVLRGKKYLLEKQSHGGQIPYSKGSEKISDPSETAQKIAEETGVTSRTVYNDALLAQAVEELTQHIPREILKQNPKQDIIELYKKPPEEKKKIIKVIEEDRLSIKKARQKIIRDLYTEPSILTNNEKYDVILADPPWQYEFSMAINRAIENQYPTMTLDEIKQLQIPSAENAVLFLWATAPKLEEALEVMRAWGFKYRTCAVWDKEVIGMGFWFRIQHELLLVGVKGNYPVPPPDSRFSSIIRERRGKHSEKPKLIYEMIEKMCPKGKYLELFARETRQGWKAWGNEI